MGGVNHQQKFKRYLPPSSTSKCFPRGFRRGRAVNSGNSATSPNAGACRYAGCGKKASRHAVTPQLRPQDKVSLPVTATGRTDEDRWRCPETLVLPPWRDQKPLSGQSSVWLGSRKSICTYASLSPICVALAGLFSQRGRISRGVAPGCHVMGFQPGDAGWRAWIFIGLRVLLRL